MKRDPFEEMMGGLFSNELVLFRLQGGADTVLAIHVQREEYFIDEGRCKKGNI